MGSVIQIILACIGSTGLYSFIQFMIQRKDKKNDLASKLIKRIDTLERDDCRIQLMVLMSDYPENTNEIMKVAEHYFSNLHGDWYMTTLFNDYLNNKKLLKPSWFNVND